MNEQSLQNTPFTPGRPVVVPTNSFTREVQESIVDNYFNATGSVYANTVDAYNQQFRPQSTEAAMTTQPQQPATQQGTPQLSADEIASLTKIKSMIDSNPNILSEIARRELSQSNQPQQAAPAGGMENPVPNQIPKSETSSADMWDQLFSQKSDSGAPQEQHNTVSDQQTGQSAPSQSPSAFDSNFNETLYAECLKAGQDYEEVSSFASEFVKDPTGFIELYKAMQDIQRQQSQQAQGGTPPHQALQGQHANPVNLSEAPTPNGVRILASPAFGTRNANPYWR